jgi:hypothetical protein
MENLLEKKPVVYALRFDHRLELAALNSFKVHGCLAGYWKNRYF